MQLLQKQLLQKQLLQKLNLIASGGALALSLADAKLHLNILDTSFDSLITDYITAAQEMLYLEASIGVDATVVGYLPALLDFTIDVHTLSTVVIKYYDSSNVLQTLADTEYIITDNLVEITGTTPTVYDRDLPYQVTVTTPTPTDAMVVQCLRMIVADFFESRQANEIGAIKEISRTTAWQLSLISKRVEI